MRKLEKETMPKNHINKSKKIFKVKLKLLENI